MKIIVCFRHLICICRKWRRGIDYSWHVQHLLREFGRGQFAEPRSVGVSRPAFPFGLEFVEGYVQIPFNHDYTRVRICLLPTS
jgi:hypothetical protein